MRRLATRFLRHTARGPLVEALPESPGERSLPARLQGTLFRVVGRSVGLVLTAKRKAAIQDWLINRYRIPVDLQPRPQLEAKLREALEWLCEPGDETLGDYLEFGVYQGNSLICMHRVLEDLGLDEVRLFGFDSFEGFPESADLDDVWSPGQFRSDIEFTREILTDAGIDWERTELVKGFYDEVLDDALTRRLGIERASIIMIDCDLYASTCQALAWCEPLMAERCVVFFDDWTSTDEEHGEQRAFAEFLAEHPGFEVRDLGGYHAQARVLQMVRRGGDSESRVESATP